MRTQEVYARALNNALVKVTSGAYSYGQAIEEAVRELARSGLRTVDFDSGVSRQLDTAARNAVLTASSQLAGQITMHNVEMTGVAHVEVSSHLGAREGGGHANHLGWQGKVYRVEGSDAEYANLEEATGYPSDPAGLCGYNCRHSFYPFWPGISEPNPMVQEPPPVTVDGREYTYYQATQEQRRREREIRALKREANAFKDAGKPELAAPVRARLREKTERYKAFSEDVGIRAKTERLRVGNHADETAVHKHAISPAHMLPEAAKRDILSVKTTDGGDGVRVIAKIDKEIYACIMNDIAVDDVVITDERIEHSNRHQNAYEKYKDALPRIIAAPDYIFADKRSPNTGLVVGSLFTDDGRRMQIILRLKIPEDPEEYMNSVISCWDISEARLENYINNRKMLYKKPGL